MSGNVYPNPGPIFLCSVCAANVTWLSTFNAVRGKSVQCCACSKWVHLRCSRLSLFKFRTFGSSHSCSCPPCCVLACNTVTSTDLYTSIVQPALSANAALLPHPRPQTSCPPSAHSVSSLSALTIVSCSWLSYASCFLSPPWLPQGFSMECWRSPARSTELLHFLSPHPVDLICIQEFNLSSKIVKIGFLDTDTANRMGRKKVLQFNAPGSDPWILCSAF